VKFAIGVSLDPLTFFITGAVMQVEEFLNQALLFEFR
jgi:hypothetical protein